MGLPKCGDGYLGHAHVLYFPFVDEFLSATSSRISKMSNQSYLESSHRFLDWRLFVVAVQVVEIDAVHSQTLQGAFKEVVVTSKDEKRCRPWQLFFMNSGDEFRAIPCAAWIEPHFVAILNLPFRSIVALSVTGHHFVAVSLGERVSRISCSFV